MGKSDAELREAVIAGWHRLESEVRSNPDRLAGLVALTGMPFRELDLVRRVRNRIAHPDEPVPRERLMAALKIIADAELRLAARRRKPKKRPTDRTAGRRPGKATPRQPARRAQPRRPRRRGAKAGPAKRTRTRSIAIVITVVALVAVAVAVLVMLPA